MNERDLERLAPQLGEREARGIDPERIVVVVAARLKSERMIGGHALTWRWVVRIAAAAALVAAVGLFALRDHGPSELSTASLAAAVQGIEALRATELSEVLDSLAFAGPVTTIGANTLDDLTVPQLEELLERLEG